MGGIAIVCEAPVPIRGSHLRREPLGTPRRFVAATLMPVPASTTWTEYEMSRYAIAFFLLLLLGAATGELVQRSTADPDASVGAAMEDDR